MSDILDSLWVEKYRPKNLNDIILDTVQFEFFKNCIEQLEIPNLLFCGPQGSGKTTLASILYKNIIKDEGDILILNGSSERGIDVVRSQIEPFLSSPPLGSKIKIVFIDEFDYMTPESQASLRNIFEKYHSIGRFLCTGNYSSKIIKPLHSRFQTFEFKKIDKNFIVDYCSKILTLEKIEYKKDSIEIIVQSLSPDIRKIINTLQRNCVNKQLKGITKEDLITTDNKIISIIIQLIENIGTPNQGSCVNTAIPEIINILNKTEPDYMYIYENLFESEIIAWAKIIVNKYANNHLNSAIPKMHFMAMFWEIIEVGNKLVNSYKK